MPMRQSGGITRDSLPQATAYYGEHGRYTIAGDGGGELGGVRHISALVQGRGAGSKRHTRRSNHMYTPHVAFLDFVRFLDPPNWVSAYPVIGLMLCR